ncbi:peroxidase-like isoform X2 [Trifolium pratense]|uniref:peroxidase-like isoform X2 n=1 Tax=Trifolium pratense TaxID=57577 RepID=UPI001E6928E1|nr:peroxidase-like isoform X2 [Trifolium pratense]
MASHHIQYFIVLLMATLFITIQSHSHAKLTPDFYNDVCPQALPIIKSIVSQKLNFKPRMGAHLLRLHFHDCFVNLGGPTYWYEVLLGRRDARNTTKEAAELYLPSQLFNFSQLVSNFKSQGLNLKDLVTLSGAHTIGMARCSTFKDRIYNDTNIDPNFAISLQQNCPIKGGDDNMEALDYVTPEKFDNSYYKNLVSKKGLFHSDQELFNNGIDCESDMLVELYSGDSNVFARNFGTSMIKMGNIKPLTGIFGEIRTDCTKVN